MQGWHKTRTWAIFTSSTSASQSNVGTGWKSSNLHRQHFLWDQSDLVDICCHYFHHLCHRSWSLLLNWCGRPFFLLRDLSYLRTIDLLAFTRTIDPPDCSWYQDLEEPRTHPALRKRSQDQADESVSPVLRVNNDAEYRRSIVTFVEHGNRSFIACIKVYLLAFLQALGLQVLPRIPAGLNISQLYWCCILTGNCDEPRLTNQEAIYDVKDHLIDFPAPEANRNKCSNHSKHDQWLLTRFWTGRTAWL